ncbi:hypothetical protein [Streptomyces sp. XH2]|uniref:hypothetical protein n=1 Tax=Streptomyces sp. XH2 TaxID=3412483 RepID=UPI003C7BC704
MVSKRSCQARDWGLRLLGVAVAGFLQAGYGTVALAVGASFMFVALIAYLVEEATCVSHPVVALRALELKVITFWSTAIVLIYAGILLVVFELLRNAVDPVKYWAASGTGLLILAAPAVVTPPGEFDNWIGVHAKNRFLGFYKPYFQREDPATGELVGGAHVRLYPGGQEAQALRFDFYYDSIARETVTGWKHKARLARARTLDAGLHGR